MISQNPFNEFDDTMKRLGDGKIRNIYGMNPELFYSLPYDIQCALMHSYWEATQNEQSKTNGEKLSVAKKKQDLEKKSKIKVLSFFKKKK